MVEAKYKATKEEAMAEVRKASAVSLTADMWTSMNMDAYLAVTCHYITDQAKLSTVLLGVGKFTQSHTPAHLAEVKHTPPPLHQIGRASCRERVSSPV